MFKKLFSIFAALTLCVGLFAKTSVITYTATEKLPEVVSTGWGLHTDAFYAADSTQLTVTHTFDQGVGTITFNGEVAIIGNFAFNNCSSLQSIDIPASVTTIGKYAFNKCSSLISITIPANVTTIGASAFFGCGLISITLSENLTSIGENAFYSCSALASVTFEGNACQDAIGANAFYDVGATTPATLVLPNNWTGSKPVDNQTKWYGGYFTLAAPAKTSVITYTATEKLPEATGTWSSGLHTNAFYAADSTQLTVTHTFDEAESVGTITLNGEVAIIGDRAFYNCAITSITLPASVTTIGESSFLQCCSLSSVTLPEGLKTIGESAFEVCEALSAITIPSSVTTIGAYAFNSTGMESITFAEGSQLNSIGDDAFWYCSLLKSIDIPASVTTIGGSAFGNCSSLQSVTLPATLKSIGMSTFWKCAALTSITLPTALDSIGVNAFAQSGLESITIPASVDTIAAYAFWACTSLTSIVVEAGNTKYDSRDNCNGIVEKATNTLIAACPATIIPNTVAILDQEVFEMLPITAITIPASVTTIKGLAFGDCSSLAEVTVQWTTADAIPSGDNMASHVFSGIAAGAKLRVPTGTRALYEAAEQWKDFTIIEEYTPTALPTLFGDGVKGNKFFHNGQMIIRKDAKLYNAVGQEIR